MVDKTILVVEDDFDVRDSITGVLEDEGYTVVCAEDGRQALDALRGGVRPAAILLDLMMAGMNGYQFRKEQLSDPDLSQIPVIVLTADRNVNMRARELAADAYLRKPTSIDELLGALRRYG